jgi:nucleotide-binding universal stress UspA family protein
MSAIRCILVPTDFSEGSGAALAYAQTLAQAFGARIELVHAWAAPPYIPAEAIVDAGQGAQALSVLAAQHAQQQMQELLAQRGGLSGASVTTRAGDPTHVILELAEAKQADLIVMGTHGRSGLSHLLMGSVTEKVVRRATCPVLTVRMPESS